MLCDALIIGFGNQTAQFVGRSGRKAQFGIPQLGAEQFYELFQRGWFHCHAVGCREDFFHRGVLLQHGIDFGPRAIKDGTVGLVGPAGEKFLDDDPAARSSQDSDVVKDIDCLLVRIIFPRDFARVLKQGIQFVITVRSVFCDVIKFFTVDRLPHVASSYDACQHLGRHATGVITHFLDQHIVVKQQLVAGVIPVGTHIVQDILLRSHDGPLPELQYAWLD